MKDYIVINLSEDGPYIDWMTKETLLERLAESYWGDDVKINTDEIDSLQEYAGTSITIIKGTIVNPKPVEVVKAYDID